MMRPALHLRACPLCGSHACRPEIGAAHDTDTRSLDELRQFWFGIDKARHFFTYYRCQCGMLFNPVFFDDAQLHDLYSAMPPNMDQVPSAAIIATQRGYFEAAMAEALTEGSYLEIGPDVGHIATEAARRNLFDRFWLFEPNRAVHKTLASGLKGRDARIVGSMSGLSVVPDASVSLAVMVHVLDHLLDPAHMLETILAKLRPDGLLMLVTHNEDSLLRRALGRRWPAFCLQHPELYNPRTIRLMLHRAGYSDVSVTGSTNHFPIDFLGRQLAAAFGIKQRLPLPSWTLKLQLGNMLTLARRADAQAASVDTRVPEVVA